jgi:hypothetical protein
MNAPDGVERARGQVHDQPLVGGVDVGRGVSAPPRPTRQSFESYFHKVAAGPWVIARLNWNLKLDMCDGVGKGGGLVLTAGEIGNVVLSSGLYATMRESIGNVESISLCLMGDGG